DARELGLVGRRGGLAGALAALVDVEPGIAIARIAGVAIVRVAEAGSAERPRAKARAPEATVAEPTVVERTVAEPTVAQRVGGEGGHRARELLGLAALHVELPPDLLELRLAGREGASGLLPLVREGRHLHLEGLRA